jgi:hypothetical protein
MEMVRVGGHFVQVTTANNYMGHGFWQLSPEAIYRAFSRENGFSIRAVFLREVVVSGAWYKVEDPAINGGRVELINRRPTYICTIAQRLAKAEIFAAWPHQSDYAEAWKNASQIPNLQPASLRRSIRKQIPRPIKAAVRAGIRMLQMKAKAFDYPYYSKISTKNLINGCIRLEGREN